MGGDIKVHRSKQARALKRGDFSCVTEGRGMVQKAEEYGLKFRTALWKGSARTFISQGT